MGIYIPSVSMPKDETAIHLELHSDGIVLMWQMGDDDKVVGTAIELPPHGRLGDLDALADKYISEIPDGIFALKDKRNVPAFVSLMIALLGDIAEADTIIPAEGE